MDLRRNPDGTFRVNTFTTSNPLQTAALSDISEDVWRFVSGATLDWTMLQGERSSLKFTTTGGLDFFNQKNRLFFPPELQFEPNDGLLGTSLLTKSDNVNLNLQGGLIHTLAGSGFRATTSGGVQYARRDLDIDRTTGRNLVGGQSNVDAATSIAKEQQRELIKDLGYFLQEEVLLADERLLLTAGIRADQSSLNSDADKLFWYPKAAASYRLPGLLGLGSEFKLRGAYGESGNQPRYGQKFTPIASTSSIGGLPGLVISTGNETGAADLRPERLREFEFGFDGSLGNGRTTFELTGYQKNVKDLLLRRDLPESSGFQRLIFNGARLRTRGLEAAVGITPFESRELLLVLPHHVLDEPLDAHPAGRASLPAGRVRCRAGDLAVRGGHVGNPHGGQRHLAGRQRRGPARGRQQPEVPDGVQQQPDVRTIRAELPVGLAERQQHQQSDQAAL